VEVVDTTGAGDTFNAAFAVAAAEGKKIKECIRFANRAASLSIIKLGAQSGMPTREEVEKSLV
jgi:ribokinase